VSPPSHGVASAGELAAAATASAEAALKALDRRAFLRLAGLAAGAGLLPSGCSDLPGSLVPPPELSLRHLSPRGYAVLTAATARIAGPDAAELIAAGALQPARAAEELLSQAPELASPLGQALLALEFGVWPLLGKLRPFTALDDAGRDAVLGELMTSQVALKRQLFNGVRSVALLGFYGALSENRPEGFGLGAIPADASIAQAMAE